MAGSTITDAYQGLNQSAQSCLLVVAFGAFFLLLELSMTHSPVAGLIAKLLNSNAELDDYAEKKGTTKEKEVKRCTPMVVTRVVGFIHNSIQVPIAVWAICNPELRHDRLYGTFALTHYMLCAAGGFFLHDAVSCLMRESPFYVIHGLTCCAGYTLGAAFGCGHFYGGLFLMWEVSTPFVQLRWILQKMGRTETVLYKANGGLMFLSFGIARIIFGTYFTGLLVFDTYTELRHPTPGQHQPKAIFVGFCAAALTISCLNYYWFSQMCSIMMRVLRKGHTWTEISEGKEE